MGAAAPLGNSPAAGLGSVLSGDLPVSQQGRGSSGRSEHPGGDGGTGCSCWGGFWNAWLRVCGDAGGTSVLHLPRLEQKPLSSPPATGASRAATLPGAGTWGQTAPRSATSVSLPYLLTPFLTPLLVQVSLPAGGRDTQGLALPSSRDFSPRTGEAWTCQVGRLTLKCPFAPISVPSAPPLHQAVAKEAELDSGGSSRSRLAGNQRQSLAWHPGAAA